jgi:hypothetical protein
MRRWGVAWGVLLVLLGVLFLAEEAGLLPVPAMSLLWPLVLVIVGAWLVATAAMRPRAPHLTPVAVPLAGASATRIVVKHGAGRLWIGGGAQPGMAVQGEAAGIVHRETRGPQGLVAELSVGEQGAWAWEPGGIDWRLHLTEAVPVALELYVGASENTIDLTSVRCTELVLETGASSTDISLPAFAGVTTVAVRTGAASVRLRVPEGVAARVTGSAGLATIQVDERRFPRVAHGWESPGFASAGSRVEIRADVGVGSVQVV